MALYGLFLGYPPVPFALFAVIEMIGRVGSGPVLDYRPLIGVITSMFIIAIAWTCCFALRGCSSDAGSDFDGTNL